MNIKNLLIRIKSLLLQIIFLHETILIKKLKKKPYHAQNIINMIRLIVKQENVDFELARKVAFCESRYNPDSKNWVTGFGFDRGLYQWNEYYHPEISDACAFDPECATRKFCQAVKAGNLYWWNLSKSCWG